MVFLSVDDFKHLFPTGLPLHQAADHPMVEVMAAILEVMRNYSFAYR